MLYPLNRSLSVLFLSSLAALVWFSTVLPVCAAEANPPAKPAAKPTAKPVQPATADYISHSSTLSTADTDPNKTLILDLTRPWDESSFEENALVADCRVLDEGLRFFVAGVNERAVWHRSLGTETQIIRYPILVMQYRASGIKPSGEYGLWMDEGTGSSLGGMVIVPSRELKLDGQFHEIRVDLRKIPRGKSAFGDKIKGFLFGLRGEQPNAYCEIKQIRFEADPESKIAPIIYGRLSTAMLVVDSQNKPMPGVQVDVWNDWQNQTRSSKTRENGIAPMDSSIPTNMTLTGWANSQRIVPRVKGMIPVQLKIPVSQTSPYQMAYMMLQTTRLAGTLQDTQGKPVPGARVVVNVDSSPGLVTPGSWTAVAITDENGRFETPDVPIEPGPNETLQYTVRINHPDYASGVLTDLQGKRLFFAAEDLVTSSVPLVMRKGVNVKGIVTGPDGKPLGGVRVSAPTSSFDKHAFNYRLPRTVTAKNGTFNIGPFGPGTHTIHVSHPRFTPAFIPVTGAAQAAELPLNVTLKPGLPIKARLTDEYGLPMSATITIGDFNGMKLPLYDGRFDKDGRLNWANPPQQPIRMDLRILNDGRQLPVIPIILAPGETEYTLRYSPGKGGVDILPAPALTSDPAPLPGPLAELQNDPARQMRIMPTGRWVSSGYYRTWPFAMAANFQDGQLTIVSQAVHNSYYANTLAQVVDTSTYPIVVLRYKGRLLKNEKPIEQIGRAHLSVAPILWSEQIDIAAIDHKQNAYLKEAAQEIILDNKEREIRIDTRLFIGLSGLRNAIGGYLDTLGIPDDITTEVDITQIWIQRDGPPVSLEKQPLSFKVHVVDHKNTPAAGVPVVLNANIDGLRKVGTTNAAGEAEFTLPPAPVMYHSLCIEDERYFRHMTLIDKNPMKIVAIPRNRFSVRVVNSQGKPIPKAHVRALITYESSTHGWQTMHPTGITDSQGIFTVDVPGYPETIAWLSANTMDGLSAKTEPRARSAPYFNPPIDKTPTLTLRQGHKLDISVKDADGKPFPYGFVTYKTDNYATGVSQTNTDVNGQLHLENTFRDDGPIDFTVHAPGFAPVYVHLPPSADRPTVVKQSVTLSPGAATLRGISLDDKGNPVVNKPVAVKVSAGADMTAQERSYIPMGLRDRVIVWRGTTDNVGAFEATGLPVGLVRVCHGDQNAATLAIGPGRRETPFTLKPGINEAKFQYLFNRELVITARDKKTGKVIPDISYRVDVADEWTPAERTRLMSWDSYRYTPNRKTYIPAQYDVIIVVGAGVYYKTIERSFPAGTTPIKIDIELDRW